MRREAYHMTCNDALQLIAAFPESEISEYIVLLLYHLSSGLLQVRAAWVA